MSLALAVAGRIPSAAWRPTTRAAAALAARRPPKALRQWQLNAQAATGIFPSRRETAEAGASWARNLFESAQLERWSNDDVLRTVLISDADRQRLVGAHRNGGAVIGLPHMGSWDLAGAWACLNGLPVSTVAEQIPEFDYFVRVREVLGMRVYGHRDRQAVAKLEADQRAGRMVCLVTDRRVGRGGVPVLWPTPSGPLEVRMPAGAARLALETGSTLLGIACHYQGDRMRLVVSEPLVGDDAQALTQQLADFFAGQVRQRVVDWHVLVPFFPEVVAS
ncbi:hypothetical protein AAEX63_06955 [Luteococcus sp. H138]|uniref:LpxL/LpxP family acyltransferase n=1 Tax=unclassified Luteococcus TaxID=2639923 RepID=UPI00313C6E0C